MGTFKCLAKPPIADLLFSVLAFVQLSNAFETLKWIVKYIRLFRFSIMINDVQLAVFANVLGVALFLLVVLYHYVSVNNPRRSD